MRPQVWLWGLVAVPFVTEVLDLGRLPHVGREMWTVVLMTLLVAWLIAQVKRKERALIARGDTDPLTGLWNRRRFDADLAREMIRARRLGTELALVMLDLDHFKRVNDERGHAAGDVLLRRTADHLREKTREGVDGCYRLGGDEMAILAPMASAAKDFAERTSELADAPFLAEVGAGMSLGLVFLTDEEDADTFMQRADRAMYDVKARNR